jgi:hypothetical protein
MSHVTILYLHGFASSAGGAKADFLGRQLAADSQIKFEAIEFNPDPHDFEYLTITGLINRLRQAVLACGLERFSLMGSSLGGLVALHYAHRFGGVDRLLLLAPALRYRRHLLLSREQMNRWRAEGRMLVEHYGFGRALPLRYDFHLDGLRYRVTPPPPAPIRILHGQHDEVVPIAISRQYAAAYPEQVELIELNSDHSLTDQLDFIAQQSRSYLTGKR